VDFKIGDKRTSFWQGTRTFFLKPEAYKKLCEDCPHLKSTDKKRKLIVVVCNRHECIYKKYEELWEKCLRENW